MVKRLPSHKEGRCGDMGRNMCNIKSHVDRSLRNTENDQGVELNDSHLCDNNPGSYPRRGEQSPSCKLGSCGSRYWSSRAHYVGALRGNTQHAGCACFPYLQRGGGHSFPTSHPYTESSEQGPGAATPLD